MIRRPENVHASYHAHVYFGPETVEQARRLCRETGERFGVAIGRVHEKLVGPHPHWSCQIAFGREQFDAVIGWLDAQRGGLDILVHGQTGDDLADHTEHATWLGEPSVLNLEVFGN